MLLLAGVIFCTIFMQFGCSVEQEFSVQFEADNKLLGGIETNNFKIRVLPSDTGNKDLNRVLDASLVSITDLEMIDWIIRILLIWRSFFWNVRSGS